MKRIFLFVITNLAIVVVLGIAMQLLGVDRMLAQDGFNPTALLLMAAIFGFGGLAASAAGVAKILFFVFLVFALVSFLFGRRSPAA